MLELDSLTPGQREAVEHGDGPLLIVAGAGTGKTWVLTQRIAHLIKSKRAKPEQILALTFTEKAAAEMTERVDVLLPYGFAAVPIMTFHAFGDQLLREFGLEIGLVPDIQVLSQPEQIIFFREHLFEFPLKFFRPLGNPTKFIEAMISVFSRAKDEDTTPEEYMAYVDSLRERKKNHPEDTELADDLAKQEEIAGSYGIYQELLAKAGKVDFGDQVALALKLLRDRPNVRSILEKRYRYVLVDEFQDTNYSQFQLVRMAAGRAANLTVVGDDDQSIYKFRGAAISNILNFVDVYPQAKQVVLTENFRSTQVILDTAYRLIQHNNPDRLEVKNRIDKRLIARKPEGDPVEHLHCDTLTTESDRVASTIQSWLDTKRYAPSEFAILVRSNSDADPYIRALNMRGIPWRFTGNRGLYSRPEVKLLISFLKVVTDLDDSLNLYHFVSSEIYELSMEDLHRCLHEAHYSHRPLWSVLNRIDEIESFADLSDESRMTIRKITSDLRKFLELCRDNVTGVVLYQFLTVSGYLNRLTRSGLPEDGDKLQNIARFFDVVWSFGQTGIEDRPVHFVRHLEQLMDSGDDPAAVEADPDADAVSIMTVHKAKGLEWPVVFLVGLVHNKFPHSRRSEDIVLPDALVKDRLPEGDFHLQEERRLFYVGMTRAKDRLYLTSSKDYGGVRQKKISQFVLEALDRPTVDVTLKSSAEEKIRRFAPPAGSPAHTLAPIPDDRLVTLSHYQIDDYLTCPLKYKYVHILRVPILPHHTVVYGQSLHKSVEFYHQQKVNGMKVSVEDLYRIFEGNWKSVGFLSREHEERRFEGGKNALRNFFETEEASGIVPERVEERFSFLLGNNRIEGRWDRVDDRSGELVIVDFKSSEVYQQEAADKRTADSLQLAIYAMAYEKTFERRPDTVELRFLESGIMGRAPVTDKMLEKTEKLILEASTGIRGRAYPAEPGYQNCRYCAYAEVCPSAART